MQDVERLKGNLMKNDYECKLTQQELTTIRAELEEYKLFKERYNEAAKELKIITEQNISSEKNHQRTISSKETMLQELTAEYKREIEYQKRNGRELEEKNKAVSLKLIETEGQL